MSEELLKSLIMWAPTILLAISLLFYFLVGVIRGLRKSVILLIHAALSIGICATIFFLIVRSENIDATMVNIANYILNFFGMSVQGLLGVSEELGTVKDIILDLILNSMSSEEVFYYVVVDAGAYISTLVEMIYRILLFIILFILHVFIMGFLHFIYIIFYPVRRRVRKINKAYERGEVAQPYQRRRLAGGFVGVGKGLVVNVFLLSFLGCLLFIVTGKNNPLPDRNDGTSEEISFGNETIDVVYDYYSVVCEMSDTGIFAVLNAIQDSNDKPYYFYICDLMLQGGINDEVLEISDTFYLREELGTYIGFCKDAIALVIQYAGPDTSLLLSGDQEAMLSVMKEVVKNEEFVIEFSELIDNFEKQPYIINLALCALTSMVNNIELVVGEDHAVTRLVKKVFNKETGLKITDLATEQDIKHLFKSIVSVASTALKDMEDNPKSKQNFVNAADEQAFDVKLIMKYANLLIDNIQALSIFGERSEVGNNLLKNVYEFCVEEFVSSDFKLPEIGAINWIDELNILFDAIEPVLNIAVEVYSDNSDVLMENILNMFNPEKENAEFVEQEYDKLVNKLCRSNILDLVVKIILPGETIDGFLQDLTGNPEACMPHSFSIASSNGQDGELEILLRVFKDFLKNDGIQIIELLGEEISEESLNKLFELLKVDIDPSEEVEEKLIDTLLSSKVFRYFISSFITYSNLGGFDLYIPTSASEIIQETVKVTDSEGNKKEETRTHNIIKAKELSVLTDFILNSPDFIFDLINKSEDIDYVELLTSDTIVDLLKDSVLLQGIIASIVISVSNDMDMIVLPYTYDNPDTWIKYKEIDSLINAIITLKNEETESGESLFNQLMGGSFDINTILNLSQETIDSIYKSKVLKYTVSDLLTNLGSTGFSIVVPGVSCEIPNAATTNPDKKVNVISSNEILTIFDQIKNIIKFDSNNNVTILYSKMFNNKTEILSSYTIQATVMNMLINMTGEEGAIISVPKDYKEAYKSFLTIATIEQLEDNKWFGKTIEDCELHLLFEGIESLISDEHKDENGNILDSFSLDKIASDIQIDRNTIDIVSTSAILNSTLSNIITTNFATPIAVFENDRITKDELTNLIDALFVLLDKDLETDKITFNEISSLNISEISKGDINQYKKSQIFMTALSDMVMQTGVVIIPIVATEQVPIVKLNDKNVAYRIKDIEDDNSNPNEIDELDNFLDCLFEFFGTGTGDSKVIDINSIKTDDLVLNKTKINMITSSTIFTATLSNLIGETEVIIPTSVAKNSDIADGTKKYILETEELNQTLSLFLDLFGNKNEDDEQELDINNINLDNFVINETVKNDILQSEILCATISNYLITKDLGIIVPSNEETINEILVVGAEGFKTTITKQEIDSFLDAALNLFGTDNNGTKELNINNIDTSNFIIKGGEDGNIDELSSSYIINATITQELAKLDDLIIPIYDGDEETVSIIPTANGNVRCAIINDIVGFLNNMVDILGGTKKEINPNELSSISVELVKGEELHPILRSTIAIKLLENESIFVPDEKGIIESLKVLSFENNEITSIDKDLLEEKQFNDFKDTLIDLLGKNGKYTINSLDQGVNVDNIVITKNHINSNHDDYLFKSSIFAAIIADAILKVDELTIPSIVKEQRKFYNKPINTKTIYTEQVVALFNSIFVATGLEELDINNFDINNIKLPDNETNAKNMFESLILAATVSDTITNSTAADSLIIIEKAIGSYEYLGKTDNEKYITIEELTNLLLALKNGFGKNDASDFSVSEVVIPNPNEEKDQYGKNKMDYLLDSLLIRTIISKEIMNQKTGDTVIKLENKAEICAVEKQAFTDNKEVLLISEQEIINLINGINKLGFSNAGFNGLNLDLNTIKTMISTPGLVKIIAASAVLRSVVSDLLDTDSGFGSYKIWQLLNSSEPTYYISETELYRYNKAGNRYFLNGHDRLKVYTTFEINGSEPQEIQMYDRADILALENMTLLGL